MELYNPHEHLTSNLLDLLFYVMLFTSRFNVEIDKLNLIKQTCNKHQEFNFIMFVQHFQYSYFLRINVLILVLRLCVCVCANGFPHPILIGAEENPTCKHVWHIQAYKKHIQTKADSWLATKSPRITSTVRTNFGSGNAIDVTAEKSNLLLIRWI